MKQNKRIRENTADMVFNLQMKMHSWETCSTKAMKFFLTFLTVRMPLSVSATEMQSKQHLERKVFVFGVWMTVKSVDSICTNDAMPVSFSVLFLSFSKAFFKKIVFVKCYLCQHGRLQKNRENTPDFAFDLQMKMRS